MIMNLNPNWNRFRRRGPVAGRGIKSPRALELRYDRLLREAFEAELFRLPEELLAGHGEDMTLADVLAWLDRRRVRLADNVAARLGHDLSGWFGDVDGHVARRFQAGVRGALGIDAVSVPVGDEFGEIGEKAIRDNLALARREVRSFMDDLADAVIADHRGEDFRHGSKSLAGEIQAITGLSRERASFIARDQTARLTGRLSRARQEDAGVTHYIWRTAGDNRVVGAPGGLYPRGNKRHGDHYARDGKLFAWAVPPKGDGCHPQEAILCRCVAIPVFEPARLNLVPAGGGPRPAAAVEELAEATA